METFGRAVAGQRDHANVELGNAATADMLNYFEQALADRAEHPREDVLSLLAAEPSNAETRADVRANCIFFILAGHVTTTALLSAGVHLLAEHPTQLAQLLTSPAGWPAAVEELLCFVSPTTLTGTTASMDAEVPDSDLRRMADPSLIGGAVEPYFASGGLLIGVMASSAQAADLRRDQRYVLRSAVTGPDAGERELKQSGIAGKLPVPAVERPEEFLP